MNIPALPSLQRAPLPLPNHEPAPVDQLTDDTLLTLFKLLPPLSLITNLPLVCKRWQRLCNHAPLWQQIVYETWPDLAQKKTLFPSFKNFFIGQLKLHTPPQKPYCIPRTASARIDKLSPHMAIFHGELLVSTNYGNLLTLNPFDARTECHITPGLPPGSYILSLDAFPNFATLIILYPDSDRRGTQKAAVAIDPGTGKILAFSEHPAGSHHLHTSQTHIYCRAQTSLFALDYWTGEITQVLPGIDHTHTRIHQEKAYVPTRAGIAIYPLPSPQKPTTLRPPGELFHAENGFLFTQGPGCILHITDEATGKLSNTLDLKTLCKKERQMHLAQIKILENLLVLSITYKYYFNSRGEIVPQNLDTDEACESSLYFYDLKTLKLTRTLHFENLISPDFTLYLGNLLLHEDNTNHSLHKRIQVFNLADPLKSTSCSLL